ncbi:hypothetical protein N9Z25_05350 [Luminiphilus sp.]|nr:hypothetical protein [Luminiphilus sp.]
MGLAQENVSELKDTIEAANARQAELRAKHDDARSTVASLQAKIKENETTNDTLKREMQEFEQQMRVIASEFNPLNETITEAEKRIAEYLYAKALEELIDKQEGFYTVCERLLTKTQEELADTVGDFVEFIDPATAVANMRAAIEDGGIGYNLLPLRAGRDNYDKAIRDLCEAKLNDRPIELSAGMLPVDRIKDWLRTDAVIQYWKK